MIMGREQTAAMIDFMQMLQHSPGDGQTVISRRPPSDFIQNDQCAFPCVSQNRRSFHHFDHKGRTPRRQIICRADPAEQAIDHADMRRARRNE